MLNKIEYTTRIKRNFMQIESRAWIDFYKDEMIENKLETPTQAKVDKKYYDPEKENKMTTDNKNDTITETNKNQEVENDTKFGAKRHQRLGRGV